MNSQQQSQSFTISQIDNEFIFDTNHILMNYLKMYSLSSTCFSETTIHISQSILAQVQTVSLLTDWLRNHSTPQVSVVT